MDCNAVWGIASVEVTDWQIMLYTSPISDLKPDGNKGGNVYVDELPPIRQTLLFRLGPCGITITNVHIAKHAIQRLDSNTTRIVLYSSDAGS